MTHNNSNDRDILKNVQDMISLCRDNYNHYGPYMFSIDGGKTWYHVNEEANRLVNEAIDTVTVDTKSETT